VEGFEPYAQRAVLSKVAGLVSPGGVLYIVAAEPPPLRSEVTVVLTSQDASTAASFPGGAGPAGRLLASVTEVRDASVLLSGERPYREFPLSWYVEAVGAVGLEVVEVAAFPAVRTKKWALNQLAVARHHLVTPVVGVGGGDGGGGGSGGLHYEQSVTRGGGLDAATASAMRRHITAIEEEVRASPDLEGGTCFGMDFVIAARRKPM